MNPQALRSITQCLNYNLYRPIQTVDTCSKTCKQTKILLVNFMYNYVHIKT